MAVCVHLWFWYISLSDLVFCHYFCASLGDAGTHPGIANLTQVHKYLYIDKPSIYGAQLYHDHLYNAKYNLLHNQNTQRPYYHINN